VDARVSVVVLTHNRRLELVRALRHACALPSKPRVIVVDNGSSDGTAEMVADEFPEVVVAHAGRNLGAAGRNVGLRVAATPFVALADDDTWWTEDGLERAIDVLECHRRVAVVSGRVLVGADAHVDPTCRMMAGSPLPRDATLPGPRLLGFLAGASMVRREPVLAVGGFEPRLFLGGEESLLATDLAAAGWATVYDDDVVVHHQPSGQRDAHARRALTYRNDLWFAWRRRPLRIAVAATAALAREALRDRDARRALAAALRGLPWTCATRRRLPETLEEDWRRLDRAMRGARATIARERTHPRVPRVPPTRGPGAATRSVPPPRA
jgi:N-acetylglucosaminyl-diphospho-decaprenol L-rhamnosyltransferase